MRPMDEPLKVEVVKGRLVISIGVQTLAFAYTHSDLNNPYNEKTCEFQKLYEVTKPNDLAESVAMELNREEEDGTTPVHKMLDKVFEDVVENGGEGIEEVE